MDAATPLYAMLQTFGTSRTESMTAVNTAKLQRLLEMLPSLPPKRLQALLKAASPHVGKKSLQPFVFRLMELSPLPAELLDRLEADESLVRSMPAGARRCVLAARPNLFLRQVL